MLKFIFLRLHEITEPASARCGFLNCQCVNKFADFGSQLLLLSFSHVSLLALFYSLFLLLIPDIKVSLHAFLFQGLCTTYNLLDLLHGWLGIFDFLHLLLIQNLAKTVDDLQTLILMGLFVENSWICCLDEYFEGAAGKFSLDHTLGRGQTDQEVARLGKRTDFGGSQDAFLSCQREEFFVGIGKLECRWQVCFNEYGPCIIHFLTFWAFIMILTENFKEET